MLSLVDRPGRPWNAGLFFSLGGKATLLWPGLPQNPGLDWVYQAFPGHAFLASPANTLASRACHAFDRTPDARVEGNQDSPCLVCLPNFRGVIMWIINVHFRLEMHFIFLTRLLISDNILHWKCTGHVTALNIYCCNML